MSNRFEAIGSFVYEKGNRIGVTPNEASVELAQKLNAYQMRIERLKAEVERLTAELSNISGWGRGLESDLSHARVEISFLKAEVERLTEDNRQLKKVFEIAEGIIKRMGNAAENAAKEGKPSV